MNVLKFNYFNVYYQNVRGLRSKTQEFYKNLCNSNFDVIILTETWLNDGILDTELFDHKYSVYRRDREVGGSSKKKDGGGVLVAVLKSLHSKRIFSFESSGEDIWITFDIKHNKLTQKYLLCAVYLPPPVTITSVDTFVDNCNRVFELCDLHKLIVGDFNLGCIDWNLAGRSTDSLPGMAEVLVDFHCLNNLQQLNSVVNSSNRVLDLVFTDIINCKVINSSTTLSKIDPLHPPLVITLPFQQTSHLQNNPNNKYLNFRKADYEKINEALDAVDWASLFDNCVDVNQMVGSFEGTLDQIIERSVPQFFKKQTKYPPWYTRNLIRRLNEKEKIRTKVRKYNNPLDVLELRILKKRCDSLLTDFYNNYIRNVENKVKNDPKYFWTYIKMKKNAHNCLPATMTDHNGSSSDGTSICNMFGNFFAASVSQGVNTSLGGASDCGTLCADTFSNIKIRHNELKQKLESLDVSKGAGPDGIPPLFIKRCSKTLMTPLLLLFPLWCR
ncbi:hypothetical protein ABMA28_017413 [Loxostege sticticalis]|uniref:Endonuclease/exonuclease/phosphatase domain-containing protein n=1 Tax=Loxostege sticticalis TaxID=481309 RepID=A0ABD0S277_LOXSC